MGFIETWAFLLLAIFSGGVLPRLVSIGIETFHQVSQLKMSGIGGDAGIALFT